MYDSWLSLLNHPIFIAAQKVATLCNPNPFCVFGAKMTSCDTMLAFSFASSFGVVGAFSPLIKLVMIVSIFLQYFFDGVGRTAATWLRTLSMKVFSTVILPNIVRYLCFQSFTTNSSFRIPSS